MTANGSTGGLAGCDVPAGATSCSSSPDQTQAVDPAVALGVVVYAEARGTNTGRVRFGWRATTP